MNLLKNLLQQKKYLITLKEILEAAELKKEKDIIENKLFHSFEL